MFAPKKTLLLCAVALIASLSVFADTATLLVLYTNDIHDYVKPGADNAGGMPYLAAYVASMRAERGDILLLDGGDVMEKGDMIAFKTQSRITYEAMRKMEYDAGAVGNHDIAHGIEHLRECAALAGFSLLCLNLFDADGNLVFPTSEVFEVNGVKIGIIGMHNIRTTIEKDGARLAAEARRLNAETHLLVVVAHMSSRECAQLSVMAPEVDLFISGHTHEMLQTPIVVPETGALIVQAGQYARNIGHLELVVDREAKKIIRHDGKLVFMCHDTIAPDMEMLAWIKEEEQRLCPEASEVIGKASRFINTTEMAAIAAAALQDYAQADVAFCHAGQVMRSGVFAGDVDVNALFRTGGQRGCDLVAFDMTGTQIGAYLAGLIQQKRGRTEWAGFQATLTFDNASGAWSATTNLEPERKYRVIMSEREWNQRFLRVAKEQPEFDKFDAKDFTAVDFTFTQTLASYVKKAAANGETLDAHIKTLLKNRELNP